LTLRPLYTSKGDTRATNAKTEYYCSGLLPSEIFDALVRGGSVMGLEIERSRNGVEDVAGTKFSAIPKCWGQTSSPSRTTAREIPGTLFAAMKLNAAFSACARFSAERLLLCARNGEEPEKKTKIKSATERAVISIFGKRVIGIGFT